MTVDILAYKGYEGSAELDMERQVCRGRLLFVDDLVTYEAPTPAGLRREFEAAVDDYLATCRDLGRSPKKPLKGQFNVRIPPQLHEAAVRRAFADDVKLNEVVVRALTAYISVSTDVNVHHNVVVYLRSPESPVSIVAAGSQDPRWVTGHARTH